MTLLSLIAKKARNRAPSPSSLRANLQVEQLETRLVPYNASSYLWPHPQVITLSFEPDNTVLGTQGSTTLYSNMMSTFNSKWSTSTWEYQILKAAQSWAAVTNINFSVITDSGAAIGSGPDQQGDPTIGDIRFGGYNFGNSSLAQAYMPPLAN